MDIDNSDESRMDCQQLAVALVLSADDELGPDELMLMETHLAGCAACRVQRALFYQTDHCLLTCGEVTWMAVLGVSYFFQVPETWRDRPLAGFVDAYLYLGPRDSLSHESTPSSILDDKQYLDELRRRAALGGSTFSRFDPDAIRKADANPRFYPPR
jgi:hypothetical protein